MSYGIHDHKLHHPNGVEYIPSPDHGGTIIPEAIVLHYTAGASAKSDVNWLTMRDEVYLSAHLVIGRGGEVTQLVPFNRRAYHAGKSSWNGRDELNGWSIGIEFSNWGKLKLLADRTYCSWSGAPIHSEKVVQIGDTYWERFYPIQIEIGKEVCRCLLKNYLITSIVGHYEVAPGRKIDPGAAFPIEEFRVEVLNVMEGNRLLEDRVASLEIRVTDLESKVVIDNE